MEKEDFHEELNTIKYIARANGYSSSIIHNLIKKHRKKEGNKEIREGSENGTRYITCLLYTSRCV